MQQVTYEMNGLRVVDLTKELDPATEGRRCRLTRYNTGGPIPDWHTSLDLTSHLGTHCECPYHHDESWPSVAELPLTTFLGRAHYVNLDLPRRHQITGDDLERACGGFVESGDVIILDSPHELAPFTPDTNGPLDGRLAVGAGCARWLADRGVKAVGFGDGVSVEDSNEHVRPFHDILLSRNIVFLEVLKNLHELHSRTFFMSYAPLPIVGADSCPVRAYAIEGLPGFCE